jgi:hypothetical protein
VLPEPSTLSLALISASIWFAFRSLRHIPALREPPKAVRARQKAAQGLGIASSDGPLRIWTVHDTIPSTPRFAGRRSQSLTVLRCFLARRRCRRRLRTFSVGALAGERLL